MNKEASADFNKRQTMRGESEKAGLAAAAAAMQLHRTRWASLRWLCSSFIWLQLPQVAPSSCSLAGELRLVTAGSTRTFALTASSQRERDSVSTSSSTSFAFFTPIPSCLLLEIGSCCTWTCLHHPPPQDGLPTICLPVSCILRQQLPVLQHRLRAHPIFQEVHLHQSATTCLHLAI